MTTDLIEQAFLKAHRLRQPPKGLVFHSDSDRGSESPYAHTMQEVAAYLKYYNQERLHSSNGVQSPIEYENPFRKVAGWT